MFTPTTDEYLILEDAAQPQDFRLQNSVDQAVFYRKSVAKPRTRFPETWLWKNAFSGCTEIIKLDYLACFHTYINFLLSLLTRKTRSINTFQNYFCFLNFVSNSREQETTTRGLNLLRIQYERCKNVK